MAYSEGAAESATFKVLLTLMPQTLHVGVCICDGVTLSDFITPVEILAGLNSADNPTMATQFDDAPYRFKFDYLAPKLQPVISIMNPCSPTINPTKTYDAATAEGIQYDILWVPAGPMPDPATGADVTPASEIAFIKAQAPQAKYVMSVCAGSSILAHAGVLSGKRATTNKWLFKILEANAPKDIIWVPKARWVVDGNIWTSSGVSAGADMALAFVSHLAGPQVARVIRGQVEVAEKTQEDDPFAAFHGLV